MSDYTKISGPGRKGKRRKNTTDEMLMGAANEYSQSTWTQSQYEEPLPV